MSFSRTTLYIETELRVFFVCFVYFVVILFSWVFV